MEYDGTDVFQERWDQMKEDSMATQPRTKAAKDLVNGDIILGEEGRETPVVRIRWMNHLTGLVEVKGGNQFTIPLEERVRVK